MLNLANLNRKIRVLAGHARKKLVYSDSNASAITCSAADIVMLRTTVVTLTTRPNIKKGSPRITLSLEARKLQNSERRATLYDHQLVNRRGL
jgi:hypothetical protein